MRGYGMLKKALPLSVILSMWVPYAALADNKKVPREKRSRLDAQAAIRGSGFRITTIHPMRADFSEYDKIEIAKTTNEVGERASAEELQNFTDGLARSFQQAGSFKEVIRVDKPQLAKGDAQANPALGEGSRSTDTASSEDAPLLAAEMPIFPPSFGSPSESAVLGGPDPKGLGSPGRATLPDAAVRQKGKPIAVAAAAGTKRTLLITTEMIYYKKGSRTVRALGLGGGSQRFVVRFHIYDKELGQELAMGNIAGEVNDGFGSVPFLAGNSEARTSVVAALVNRVEVRRAKAEQ